MFPFLENVPTKEELMKDEKSKIRPYFVLYFIIILIGFGLALFSAIYITVEKEFYIDKISIFLQDQKNYSAQLTPENQWRYSLSTSWVFVLLLTVVIFFYVKNWMQSMKKKNFNEFSSGFYLGLFSVSFIFFVFNWQVFKQISIIGSNDLSGIALVCSMVLLSLAYFVFGRKCAKISKQFRLAEAAQKQKEFQEFIVKNQQNQNTDQQFPFFPFQTQPQNTVNNEQQSAEFQQKNSASQYSSEEQELFNEYPPLKDSKYWKKLKDISREDLLKMASMLNIFEPENMSDLKLKAKIAMIYIEKDNQQKGKEDVN
ncbi:hypothetical protein [[Mycoplasma] gypis]|uniref:Transmembrane protein n=1 Tax=[Mycoplasma] gypis TaxID=92404 RepID=A0ABZ2RMI0_9BACT|nr:hypothetical protein [[Mycoplasma] gypis]MBN0919052.1 hypothetical protein [[Mycoplasma] gypis]